MDSGSMIFKGHFSKSPITLRIQNDLATFDAIAEVPLTAVVRDVEYKLDEIKASRSPVESEVKFMEEWLDKWATAFNTVFIADLKEQIVDDEAQESEELAKAAIAENESEHSGPFMVK